MTPGHRIDGYGATKILALHGWFGDESMLTPVLPYLDPSRYTCAALAYRGYGASRYADGEHTLEEIANDAVLLTDLLGWDDYVVIGHSMGGKAAQALALRTPRRVRGILAVAPVPAQAVPFQPAEWECFAGAAFDMTKRIEIIHHSTGGRLLRNFSETLAKRSQAGNDPRATRAYLDAWAATDLAAAVAGSTLPLLALVGSYDPNIKEETMRNTYMLSYTRARVEVLTNAGHYPIEEMPVAVATHLAEFTNSLD